MVLLQPSKLKTRVRFPYSAPILRPVNSVVEYLVYTEAVGSSNLSPATIQ